MTPNKFLKERPCIYGIRSLANNKIYIGKTKCIYRRCQQYIYDFNTRAIGHINDYLYNAMKKAGTNNFEMFPIEFCEIEFLSEKEIYWMMTLNSTNRNKGYNIRMDSSTGMITAPETSVKISNNLKSQWAAGMRDGHSKKLKDNWCKNEDRRKLQKEIMRKSLTKYKYLVTNATGEITSCDYQQLVDMGLKNVIATFHKKNSNDVKFKGFNIKRILISKDA